MKKGTKILIIVLAVLFLSSAAIVACLQTGVVCFVKGDSMLPSYHNGQILFLNIRSKSIQRGDVVVFTTPKYDGRLVKRVIAVEGDNVVINGSDIFVNGELIEPVSQASEDESQSMYYINTVISEGCIFCIGDNRNNSLDSRDFGEVNVNDVLGIVR